jgi:peptidyl-prolyl cis-trans isomerase A (cyclophilin A)
MTRRAHHPRAVALLSSVLSLLVSAVLVGACGGAPNDDVASDAAAKGAAIDSVNPLLKGPADTPVRSPDVYRVAFTTSAGVFTIEAQRSLSPLGADRFYEMVQANYFNGTRFFRVVPGFVAQFGMHGDPEVNDVWRERTIADEPRKTSNARGTIVFATTPEPNSRTNQFFLNLVDNAEKLDGRGFAPFGRVVEGMEVVDKLNNEYGETVNQGRLASKGNAYLRSWFPALDSIVSTKVVPADAAQSGKN